MAVAEHVKSLPEVERALFQKLNSSNVVESLIQQLQSLDDVHKGESLFRKYHEPIKTLFKAIDSFMGGITIGIQQSPDISSLVIGAVRSVFDVSIHILAKF